MLYVGMYTFPHRGHIEIIFSNVELVQLETGLSSCSIGPEWNIPFENRTFFCLNIETVALNEICKSVGEKP